MSRSPLRAVVAAALLGAAACDAAGARSAPGRHVVEIRGFQYRPATLAVATGDTVVWVNRDAVPHTATAADGAWDSGSIAAGASWSRVVAGDAGGAYTCTFHPAMTGRIDVR